MKTAAKSVSVPKWRVETFAIALVMPIALVMLIAIPALAADQKTELLWPDGAPGAKGGEPYTHRGSQRNLLGEGADAELVESLSNEKQVTPRTPPTFLFHTDEDRGVPSENSVYFYLALRRAKVPAEMHIYRTGRHGLGLAPNTPGTSTWSKCCEDWMRGRGLLEVNP